MHLYNSLNPCFNGRYSQSPRSSTSTTRYVVVLILVLMEDTLRAAASLLSAGNSFVLILVLMEDTLREQRLMFLYIPVFEVCLNF